MEEQQKSELKKCKNKAERKKLQETHKTQLESLIDKHNNEQKQLRINQQQQQCINQSLAEEKKCGNDENIDGTSESPYNDSQTGRKYKMFYTLKI